MALHSGDFIVDWMDTPRDQDRAPSDHVWVPLSRMGVGFEDLDAARFPMSRKTFEEILKGIDRGNPDGYGERIDSIDGPPISDSGGGQAEQPRFNQPTVLH